MKGIVIALAVTGLMAAAAPAKRSEKNIVVKAPVTLVEWSSGVSKQLDGILRYPNPGVGQMPPSGLASVRFQCSEDGRPAAVTLSRKSGSRDLDREALRVVSHLKTLHPLPPGIRHDQLYVANILFATSMESYHRQLAALQKEAAEHNAWFGAPDKVIAINVGSRAKGRNAS